MRRRWPAAAAPQDRTQEGDGPPDSRKETLARAAASQSTTRPALTSILIGPPASVLGSLACSWSNPWSIEFQLATSIGSSRGNPAACPPEPGGSACCYWNGHGTQCNHPAQGLADCPGLLAISAARRVARTSWSRSAAAGSRHVAITFAPAASSCVTKPRPSPPAPEPPGGSACCY